jgi:lysophospholipase L1-like esterase
VRIIFYCGENDFWSGKPVDQVKGNFSALWLKIKEDLPKSDLVYLSCKPSPKRISKWNLYQSLNLKIKKLSHSEERLHFVDISKTLLKSDMTFHKDLWRADNLHLNAGGYTKWSGADTPV